MSRIDDLLNQYGNSLEDVRKLMEQLPSAFAAELPLKTELYTAQEAKDRFGIGLPAPDYMLSITPDTSEKGYSLSYISPSSYEFRDDGMVRTPGGETFSFDEFSRQQAELLAGDVPVLSQDEQNLYKDYQRTGGQLPEVDWLKQGTPLRPGDERNEYKQLKDIFCRVFLQ